MHKKFFLLFFLLFILLPFQKNYSKTDPFAKLIITSKSATCKKDSSKKNTFLFTYHNNVLVTFADNSTIQSDELEIEIDTTQIKDKMDNSPTTTPRKQKTQDFSQFKKITFNKNLIVKSTNRMIKADKAELYLPQKTCELFGNINIEQTKMKPKDLPITTSCNYALLNMQTDQITFLGEERKPVCTTIVLEGYPGLLKKTKTKKEQLAGKKALPKAQKT